SSILFPYTTLFRSLREHGALMKAKSVRLAIENGDPDDVGGKDVARELNTLVGQSERLCQRMGQRRLPDAWNVFDQQVPACQQACQAQTYLMFLAEDDPVQLRDRPADEIDRIRLRDERW